MVTASSNCDAASTLPEGNLLRTLGEGNSLSDHQAAMSQELIPEELWEKRRQWKLWQTFRKGQTRDQQAFATNGAARGGDHFIMTSQERGRSRSRRLISTEAWQLHNQQQTLTKSYGNLETFRAETR